MSVQPRLISSNWPMLAVPGWPDKASEPNAVPSGQSREQDCSRGCRAQHRGAGTATARAILVLGGSFRVGSLALSASPEPREPGPVAADQPRLHTHRESLVLIPALLASVPRPAISSLGNHEVGFDRHDEPAKNSSYSTARRAPNG